MAEAAVEEVISPKFFCHTCSVEIADIREDFTCPSCFGGFIEEMPADSPIPDYYDADGYDNDQDEDGNSFDANLLSQVGEILFGLGTERRSLGGSRDRDRRQLRTVTGASFENGDAQDSPQNWDYRGNHTPNRRTNMEHVIQDFIVNLSGIGWGPIGPGGRGNGPVFFLGNPGDYAWGREGLDAIVTQLLNQMDSAGPPPLEKEKINEIPVIGITQDQADENLQCSVCWEDFSVGESVRKLECEHVYHDPCIVPWLELHGTCPICRKTLSADEEAKSGAEPPFSRRTWRAIYSSTPSTSSSTSTSSSGGSSSNSRRNPPDDGIDCDFDY